MPLLRRLSRKLSGKSRRRSSGRSSGKSSGKSSGRSSGKSSGRSRRVSSSESAKKLEDLPIGTKPRASDYKMSPGGTTREKVPEGYKTLMGFPVWLPAEVPQGIPVAKISKKAIQGMPVSQKSKGRIGGAKHRKRRTRRFRRRRTRTGKRC